MLGVAIERLLLHPRRRRDLHHHRRDGGRAADPWGGHSWTEACFLGLFRRGCDGSRMSSVGAAALRCGVLLLR